MTILSVDDSTTIRRIVKRTVNELGHEVLEAADGPTALEVLAANYAAVQMVILDWNMPGMTGLDVLREIRANALYKDIIVMMLTSEAEQSFVVQALQAGAKNYLTKPFDKDLLNLKIQECLSLGA
jgi:two-component system, chemotaxis family, chemotaxis protein CheY